MPNPNSSWPTRPDLLPDQTFFFRYLPRQCQPRPIRQALGLIATLTLLIFLLSIVTAATAAATTTRSGADATGHYKVNATPSNTTASTGTAATHQRLHIGVFNYRPADILRPMWQPLASYLQQHLPGHDVHLHFLDQEEMAKAVGNGLLDVVFTNPVHYVSLRVNGVLSGAIATQVTLEQGHAVSQLGGAIIRRADRNDLNRLGDLDGKSVAIPGKQYLGGYTAQAAWLMRHGVNLKQINFIELGNPHDKIINAVMQGQADAGFIRSGVLEAMVKEGRLQPDELVVIEPIQWPGFPFQVTTPLYPEWAVAALNHLGHDISRRISAALLALEPDDPAALAAGIYGFTIPKDYSLVENAMVDLRVPPFNAAPVVTFEEFVRQNLITALLILGGVLASIAFFLRVAWLNRRLNLVNKELHSVAEERNELIRRFTELANNVPGALYQYRLRADGSSHFPFASERILDVYGYPASMIANDASVVFSSIHSNDLDRLRRSITDSAKSLAQWNATYRFNHPTKGERWIEGSATPSLQPDDSITWHGYIADITEEHLNRERIQLTARVVAASHEGIVILDSHLNIIEVNPAFTRITGYDVATVKGRSPRILALDDRAPPFSDNALRLLNEGGMWRGETRLCSKQGKAIPVMLSMAPVANADQDFTHFVMLFSDITTIKQHEEELERIAHYDALTGIPNRRLLIDRLRQATALARRIEQPLAICMLDLDGFKPVNDALGHEAGDRLLVEIAQRLQSVTRSEDTVARLGGDEFTLILVNPAGAALFERILNAINQPVNLAEGTVTVSASIGVVYLEPGMQADDDQLLRMADQALYESKKRGRNRFTVYGALDTW
ncbi:MAG: diguanylate cyclase [Pusillimonas sp.]